MASGSTPHSLSPKHSSGSLQHELAIALHCRLRTKRFSHSDTIGIYLLHIERVIVGKSAVAFF
jgi:hypothetical protein